MINAIKKIKLVALIIISAFVLVVVPASAASAQGPFAGSKKNACQGANLSDSNGNCRTAESTTAIENTIKLIVNILTIIVGIVAVIMIIVNGLKFITSNGDSNSINSAKHGIAYALVGLIIAALAQVIVRFVVSQV